MCSPINISFDSNIFNNKQYGFDTNDFYISLKEAVDRKLVKIYLSIVVVEETRKHFYEAVKKYQEEAISPIMRLYRSCPSFISDSLKLPHDFQKIDDKDLLCSLFEKFIGDFHITIIEYENITVEELFQDYFNLVLPFEEKKDKRHEFPDSVIFHQIKAHFSAENPITVFTKDDGLTKALKTIPEICTALDDPESFLSELAEKFDGFDIAHQELQNNYGSLLNYINSNASSLLHSCKVTVMLSTDYRIKRPFICHIDSGNLSFSKIIDSKILSFNTDSITASITVNFQATIFTHYEYYEVTRESVQQHNGQVPIKIIWDRNGSKVSSCCMDYTFDKKTLKEESVNNAHAYTTCPNCGRNITAYNDGGNGYCSYCASNY